MRNCILILFVLCFLTSNGQNDTASLYDDAIDYFNQGIDAFKNNEIKSADSLFTRSLLIEFSKDALLNRALTRLLLNDTCSACRDLKIAGKYYNDTDALSIYSTYCLKQLDTIYFDSKYNRILTNYGFKYYEVLKKTICDTIMYGSIHKKNHFSTNEISFTSQCVDYKSVDVYASFLLKDSFRYYNYIYACTDINKLSINTIEEQIRNLLVSKYNFDTIPHKNKYFSAYIYVNTEGKIVDTKMDFNPFEFFEIDLREAIEFDIFSTLKQVPPLAPVRLFGKRVNMQYYIIVGI
jgi:hypothetical protein